MCVFSPHVCVTHMYRGLFAHVHMCTCLTCATARVEMKGNSQEFVLSFHHVGSIPHTVLKRDFLTEACWLSYKPFIFTKTGKDI